MHGVARHRPRMSLPGRSGAGDDGLGGGPEDRLAWPAGRSSLCKACQAPSAAATWSPPTALRSTVATRRRPRHGGARLWSWAASIREHQQTWADYGRTGDMSASVSRTPGAPSGEPNGTRDRNGLASPRWVPRLSRRPARQGTLRNLGGRHRRGRGTGVHRASSESALGAVPARVRGEGRREGPRAYRTLASDVPSMVWPDAGGRLSPQEDLGVAGLCLAPGARLPPFNVARLQAVGPRREAAEAEGAVVAYCGLG